MGISRMVCHMRAHHFQGMIACAMTHFAHNRTLSMVAKASHLWHTQTVLDFAKEKISRILDCLPNYQKVKSKLASQPSSFIKVKRLYGSGQPAFWFWCLVRSFLLG